MKLTPMPGWALCMAAPHSAQTASGLFIASEIDTNVKSEGVAEIISARPRDGIPMGVSPGDKVIYRGFLRFANQVGHILGSQRDCEFFLLNLDDILAVVEKPCTIGINGEYRVEP